MKQKKIKRSNIYSDDRATPEFFDTAIYNEDTEDEEDEAL